MGIERKAEEAAVSRPLREHDPEWMWRARLWAAEWKFIALMVVGIIFGSAFMLVQDGSGQGFFLAMGIALWFLILIAAFFWFRA